LQESQQPLLQSLLQQSDAEPQGWKVGRQPTHDPPTHQPVLQPHPSETGLRSHTVWPGTVVSQ
jgi:hypothetical protein